MHALRGVDLAVRRGEMVAIMGPSGCGKTTLLNCLSGLDAIDGGEVLIEGVALAAMSDRERTDYRARRMGFVFQFYNLMPVLTAVENVELPLLVARVREKEARRKRARRARPRRPRRPRRRTCPDELSGGERQRVTIARALVNDPAIVWADEPTGDLDSENAAEIIPLMRRLNVEHGLSFVIVTHDANVGHDADRLVRMRDGEVVGQSDRSRSPGSASGSSRYPRREGHDARSCSASPWDRSRRSSSVALAVVVAASRPSRCATASSSSSACGTSPAAAAARR